MYSGVFEFFSMKNQLPQIIIEENCVLHLIKALVVVIRTLENFFKIPVSRKLV